jgi:hypothetical protein
MDVFSNQGKSCIPTKSHSSLFCGVQGFHPCVRAAPHTYQILLNKTLGDRFKNIAFTAAISPMNIEQKLTQIASVT